MKKIELWIADDGTRFDDEELCAEYELKHKMWGLGIRCYNDTSKEFVVSPDEALYVELDDDISDELYEAMYAFYGFDTFPTQAGKWECHVVRVPTYREWWVQLE